MPFATPAVESAAIPRLRLAAILGAMVIVTIGLDVLLHAGFLHRFYLRPDPFLLPLKRAFQLIPLGYLSFLVLLSFVLWLMVRICISGAVAGFRFGLLCGIGIWGSSVLGLMSISTANPWLMLGWFVGQTAELGVAAAFAGAGLAGTRPTRLLLSAGGLMLVCVVLVVVLQSTGIVPTVRLD